MVVTTYGSVVDGSATSVVTPAPIDPEIESADAAPLLDDPFDADQTYYLKTSSHRTWTTQRIWSLILPLLCAGLLIGGSAFFLLRDFGHLYPGEGNGGSDTSRSIPTGSNYKEESTITDKISTSNSQDKYGSLVSTTSNKQHHTASRDYIPPDDAGASCAVHPDCSLLIGNCCPTVDGKMLECCSR
jgi:hypothetical protein